METKIPLALIGREIKKPIKEINERIIERKDNGSFYFCSDSRDVYNRTNFYSRPPINDVFKRGGVK